MSKLQLLYPAHPFTVTQAWGIYNPAYLQFGFSRHNGVDFRIGRDKKLYMPVRGILIDKGYIEEGAGNYLYFKTTEKWTVDGVECYVGFVVMHLDRLPALKVGDVLEAGAFMAIPDNTGFSTGPHTHISFFRIGDNGERLDTDKETNYTFDPSSYWSVNDFNEITDVLAVLVRHYDSEKNPATKLAFWRIIEVWIKKLADLANKV